MSKIIEKIAAYEQLIAYLETNKLLPESQSDFRRGTETLLLHLLSDIYWAVDMPSSQLTLLAFFDVSAALDTVEHEMLLKRLEISFGLSGNFLSWVSSFLSERSLCVGHEQSKSAWVHTPMISPGFGSGSRSLHHLHLRDRPSSHCHSRGLSHLCSNNIQAYIHCLVIMPLLRLWR